MSSNSVFPGPSTTAPDFPNDNTSASEFAHYGQEVPILPEIDVKRTAEEDGRTLWCTVFTGALEKDCSIEGAASYADEALSEFNKRFAP